MRDGYAIVVYTSDNERRLLTRVIYDSSLEASEYAQLATTLAWEIVELKEID